MSMYNMFLPTDMFLLPMAQFKELMLLTCTTHHLLEMCPNCPWTGTMEHDRHVLHNRDAPTADGLVEPPSAP